MVDERLWFLETLDLLTQALGSSDDLDEVTSAVLRQLEVSLPCERAELAYPYEQQAPPAEQPDLLAVLHPPYLLVVRGPWLPAHRRLLQVFGPRLVAMLNKLRTIRRLSELERAQQVAQVGSWEYDQEADRLTASPSALEILGLPRGRLPRLNDFRERIHPEDRASLWATIESDRRYLAEYRIVRPSGEERTVLAAGGVVRDHTDRAVRVFGVIQDITERKQAEKALDVMRTLIDHTHDCIEVVDPDTGRVLDVNQRACVAHGYSREEYLQLRIPDIDPIVATSPWEPLAAMLKVNRSTVLESKHRRKDGSTFPVEVSVTYVELDRPYLLAVVRDITERDRANRLLNAVVNSTPDGVFAKDLQGRFQLLNRSAAAMLGRPSQEAVGQDAFAFVTPEVAGFIETRDREVLATGKSHTYEQGINGHTYLATVSPYHDEQGQVLGLVTLARDVTELKRLEEQFRQAQKMEAVGQLAGGVAHDFNNLLTVINSYSEMMLKKLPEGDDLREMVADIHEAGERAANLTRRLLALSRKQALQPTVVDLNELLAKLVSLLQRLIGENIELILERGPGLGRARLDVGQFEQAIINLAVNARDAMREGGKLRLGTHGTADEVVVTLTDTGCGMDELTRERIFEPFFTTKAPGHGTGLGLAMVYGFVQQSQGQISVESVPGQGSTFRLEFPRVDEPMAVASVAASSPLATGAETVLLVEDEAAVRMLSRRVLQSCGYTVLEAPDGDLALQVARAHDGPVHLVITDLVMPRMGGRELAEKLALERPAMPFLFMSGYPQTEGAEEFYLQKPFGPADLARRVREVLDR